MSTVDRMSVPNKIKDLAMDVKKLNTKLGPAAGRAFLLCRTVILPVSTTIFSLG